MFLVHLLGDMMQPLHVAAALSWNSPFGDKGGLRYGLKGKGLEKNLHLFTDSIGGLAKVVRCFPGRCWN